MNTDQYLDVFLDESREHLQAVNDNILELEKQPENLELVQEIFRSAHTLKGMAATMGFEDIASLTHKMENVLDQIRNSKLAVTTEVIDIIFVAIEYLENMVNSISEGNDGKKDVSELVNRLERVEKGETVVAPTRSDQVTELAVTLEVEPTTQVKIDLDEFQMEIVQQAKEQGFSVYQITVTLTEECILKGARAYMVFEILEKKGEIIKTIPTVEEIEEGSFNGQFSFVFVSKETEEDIKAPIFKVSEIEEVEINYFTSTPSPSTMEELKEEAKSKEKQATSAVSPSKDNSQPQESKHNASKTIRVNLERIDDLLNIFEEVVIDRGRLEVIADEIANTDLKETVEHLSRVSSEMQSLILSMRMVPIEQVFNRFPRMIRGLAKDLNKQINLEIIGADTELDRTVIDEIGDPLVHLIRNSVDHGIELPGVRSQAAKPEEGTIKLRAYHSGNHVFIEIEDDGAGINRDKVQAKAIEKGLVTKAHAETLSDDEIAQFILASGFSTADKVSDISGRGVGLDVVKNKIEALGGQINIETQSGKGSIFSIQLPLTLSIIATLLVKVQKETYAIPLSSIIETVLLEDSKIMYAHGKQVMDFRGKVIPLVSLSDVFQVPREEEVDNPYHAIVVVKKGDKVTGLIVDSFIGQKEVVLKALGSYLKDVFAISGATILGDGEVALIIDPNALIK
ncbi:chemotaxis protein CheA [Oceanobacillus bengalensis]|uniref:Chemotaxis protein CheA n=1 Tax=Oceanobacillus bengalensis TaxID=1435466 RepID=A0A494Z790_9BACI|nr:chemotaxis protein CheA [Oceanobacillus bengalensis]RKQ18186.1 chemotaxis protein CheA [Oceanobacillus bengalensis]